MVGKFTPQVLGDMATLYSSITKYTSKINNIPFQIIFWTSIYVPFEDFILRWLPGSLPALLRFVPELMLYGLAFYVCGSKLLRGETLRKTPIDLLLVAFFLSTALSIIINNSNLVASIIHLRTMWRYLSVFYIVVNIDISNLEFTKLIQGLKWTSLIQGCLGSIQYFLPASFNQAFFAPKGFELGDHKVESHAASGSLKVGATAGTFSDSAILSSFLLIGMCLFFASSYVSTNSLIPDVTYLKHLGITLFGIFASKKRAALGICLIIPLFIFHTYTRPKKLLSFIWFYAALALGGIVLISLFSSGPSYSGAASREESIAITDYLLEIFSPEYWQASNDNARGWFVSTISHAIFSTQSWFGFGPDFDNTQDAIRATLSTAADVKKLERDEGVFDDSFWAAFFAYFGIVGTIIYTSILRQLYKAARWLCRYGQKSEYKVLGGTFTTLIVVAVLYTFVERIFKLRAFTFYFWLLAGLVINTCHVRMQELSRKQPFTGP